jgi:hypothetical protein
VAGSSAAAAASAAVNGSVPAPRRSRGLLSLPADSSLDDGRIAAPRSLANRYPLLPD